MKRQYVMRSIEDLSKLDITLPEHIKPLDPCRKNTKDTNGYICVLSVELDETSSKTVNELHAALLAELGSKGFFNICFYQGWFIDVYKALDNVDK